MPKLPRSRSARPTLRAAAAAAAVAVAVAFSCLHVALAGSLFRREPQLRRAELDASRTDTHVPNFPFLFDCQDSATLNCELARGSVRRALARLALVLDVAAPITSQFRFRPQCARGGGGGGGANADCVDSTLLGFGSPSGYFAYQLARDTAFDVAGAAVAAGAAGGSVFLVPQALLSQLASRKKATYDGDVALESVDVLVTVSARVKWHYGQPDAGAIKGTENDLELVALHEFLHGLGFGTESYHYYEAEYGDRLLPHASYSSAARGYQFSYPNIWDAFLLRSGDGGGGGGADSSLRPWLDRFGEFRSAATGGANKGRAYASESALLGAALSASATASALSKQQYVSATTARAVYFAARRTPSQAAARAIPIFTAKAPYDSGTSLSHFAADLGEKIMGPSADAGVSLAAAARGADSPSGLSDDALGVLYTLGYGVKGLPAPADMSGAVVSPDTSGSRARAPLAPAAFLATALLPLLVAVCGT